MMELLPVLVLAIVQGITEFLPISSSGHLVIVESLLNDSLQFAARLVAVECRIARRHAAFDLGCVLEPYLALVG